MKIALLRGINVGGKNKLLMADFKALLLKLGFENSQTYIQSGNAVFDTNSTSTNTELAKIIENELLENFELNIPVLVLDDKDLKQAIDSNPFINDDDIINKLHLTILQNKPSKAHIEKLKTINAKNDKFKIVDSFVFIYCEDKYHKTKLSNNNIEKFLFTKASTRNWKTILKLNDLTDS